MYIPVIYRGFFEDNVQLREERWRKPYKRKQIANEDYVIIVLTSE